MDVNSLINVAYEKDGYSLVAAISMLLYGQKVVIPWIVDSYKNWNLNRHSSFHLGVLKDIPLLLRRSWKVGTRCHITFISTNTPVNCPPPKRNIGWIALWKLLNSPPVKPRTPLCNFSDRTADLLASRVFKYDASLMGDDIPYYRGFNKGWLVELPTHWGLDGWPQFVQSIDLDYMMPICAPQQEFETFYQEFESAYCNGGLWISVVHPFATGRMPRWKL